MGPGSSESDATSPTQRGAKKVGRGAESGGQDAGGSECASMSPGPQQYLASCFLPAG